MSTGLLDRILNELADELYFQPGESVTVSGRFVGFCTSGSTALQFSTLLPKSTKLVSNVSITNITGGVRITTGGYVDGVGDGTSWKGRSGISFGGALYGRYATFNILKSSAFKQGTSSTNVVNNTPVVLGGNVTFTFS